MSLIRELYPDEFPPLLGEISDPPKTLRLRGNLPSPRTKVLCVVGSRKYTEYGKAACERLIDGLRGNDIAIVSGLALGMDAIAHRAALRAGLQTIAVPGSGLSPDVLYPRSHSRLAEDIESAGGGLVSEFDDDFRATPWSFPKRNRIMAGMSHAVLVVEAELRSGTLITSRLAADYSRDVLALPGPIFSKTSEGPHMLLKLGAAPVTTPEDVLKALGIEARPRLFDADAGERDLTPAERRVVEALREPAPRDQLIRRLGLTVSEANIILTTMELKGIITESLGEMRLA